MTPFTDFGRVTLKQVVVSFPDAKCCSLMASIMWRVSAKAEIQYDTLRKLAHAIYGFFFQLPKFIETKFIFQDICSKH